MSIAEAAAQELGCLEAGFSLEPPETNGGFKAENKHLQLSHVGKSKWFIR